MANPLSRLIPKRFRKDTPIVPVVRMKGMIADGGGRFNPTLSLASVAGPLQKAFSIKQAPAVAICINSPGGSPVQSRLIFKRIRDLAEEKEKPVLVFVEDAAASGGYMIAVAGDEIIADPSSVVGSIGVISAGFGFPEALDKLGVERRVYTAGTNKSTLDPFKPAKKQDVDHLKELLDDIHEVFTDVVRSRRAEKLALDNPDLFSGRFWAAEKGKELGLIDDIGDMRSVLKERFGDKTEMIVISQPRGLFSRRGGAGISGLSDMQSLSHMAADGMLAAAQERILWNRLGL
ncbi:MAG: S49 family peptidase [Pseudomonadota bacterium]